MEVLQHCIGAPNVNPDSGQTVTLSFSKEPGTVIKMSAHEARELGKRLIEVSTQVAPPMARPALVPSWDKRN